MADFIPENAINYHNNFLEKGGNIMAHPAFQLKRAKNDQYYFTLTAKNGQVIAQSEMYNSKDAAENGIESVKNNAPQAEIDDQSAAA